MFLFADNAILDASQLKDMVKARALISKLLCAHYLEIHNPFAIHIYDKGIRPYCPGVNKNDVEDSTLNSWFIHRLTADIYRLSIASKEQFERYLDLIDRKSSQALLELGSIAVKYDLYPTDYNENGSKIIADPAEREHFEKCFLNEAVLNSAFEVLAYIYFRIHGQLYAVKT